MEVLVRPLNRIVRVEPGANLLDALRAAQVPMSYSCMAGRCGTCRCKLVAGEVLEGVGDAVKVSGPSGGDAATQRCGLVTQAIEQDLGDLDGWRAYLCGAPPMVEAAMLVAKTKGIAPQHVYADTFYTQGT